MVKRLSLLLFLLGTVISESSHDSTKSPRQSTKLTNGRSAREQKGGETIYPRRDDRWDPLPRDACNPPTPRGATTFCPFFLDPHPSPTLRPLVIAHPLHFPLNLVHTYTRGSQSCLFLSLRCARGSPARFDAFTRLRRYNCRAIIKADPFFFPLPKSPVFHAPFYLSRHSLPSFSVFGSSLVSWTPGAFHCRLTPCAGDWSADRNE